MPRLLGPVAIAAAVAAALLIPAGPSLAWGLQGHRVVALVADRALQQSSPDTRLKLRQLLAADKDNRLTRNDIASEATWADVLREKSEEARTATSAWHSARLKPDHPDLASACFGRKPLPTGYPASRGPSDNCVVDKITQFEAELKDPDTSAAERLAAAQFLLNLVGDLHDPLNAIDAADHGGECTALQIGAKPPVRLSVYWDDTLVRAVAGSDAAKGAAAVIAAIAPGEAPKLAAGNPEAWALETFEVAKSVAYGFLSELPAGKHPFPARKGRQEPCASANLYRTGSDYETAALMTAKTQLAKAGIRLAAVLRDSLR
jgi:hypothetical protein